METMGRSSGSGGQIEPPDKLEFDVYKASPRRGEAGGQRPTDEGAEVPGTILPLIRLAVLGTFPPQGGRLFRIPVYRLYPVIMRNRPQQGAAGKTGGTEIHPLSG